MDGRGRGRGTRGKGWGPPQGAGAPQQGNGRGRGTTTGVPGNAAPQRPPAAQGGVWGRNVEAGGNNGNVANPGPSQRPAAQSARGRNGGHGANGGNNGNGVNGGSNGRGTNGNDQRGRGTRGTKGEGDGRPRKTFEERCQERLQRLDLVVSRPVHEGEQKTKSGSSGKGVGLFTNYFAMVKRTGWAIFHFHVDFKPNDLDTRAKKRMFRQHRETLGGEYIFDGGSLWMSHRLNQDPKVLVSVLDDTQQPVEITIKMVAELAPVDPVYLQIFNIMIRRCMELLHLEEVGRNFYDPSKEIKLPQHKLALWPGYKTSMRHHEIDILLGVEIVHKVLRTERVLDAIQWCQRNQDAVKEMLIGTTVVTHYNRKNYQIDDIDWEKTPESTFDCKGKSVTFAQYYSTKYQVRVMDMTQPLLVSRPKKKDLHRGQTDLILLIPELCQMTGLTDKMRADFRLMKDLADKVQIGPMKRVEAINNFMTQLRQNVEAKSYMTKWELDFKPELERVDGRTLDLEQVRLGGNVLVPASPEADWQNAFKSNRMEVCAVLEKWVVIVTKRDAQAANNFIENNLRVVSRTMNFVVPRPLQIVEVDNVRIQSYEKAIEDVMNCHGTSMELIFIILPFNTASFYGALKKMCTVNYGVLSQCMLTKNLSNPNNPSKVKSVATKIAIQINAKLGGIPWSIQIPCQGIMFLGYDVHHAGRGRGKSVGALVATVDNTYSHYYSTTSYHESREELSSSLVLDITKCLFAYQTRNKVLPKRIIFYRDGVGEGQLSYVYNTELDEIKRSLEAVYKDNEQQLPLLTLIVVSKRINTRIFMNGRQGIQNPSPGTVVDSVITLPERYDFYLVSQSSRQGTVSPCSYNILHDTSGWKPDNHQRLTYKLCHTYYNWSGTIAVPAPCQFAHKLAYLTGIAFGGSSSANERLADKLHYL